MTSEILKPTPGPGVILQGNSLEVLKTLPDDYFHCVVTSPPYWGIRVYGIPETLWGGDENCEHEFDIAAKGDFLRPAQTGRTADLSEDPRKRYKPGGSGCCSKCGGWWGNLGLEPTIDLYIRNLVLIFEEVKRVLRPDGVCWINIGDQYAQSGKRATKEDLDGCAQRTKDKDYATGAFKGSRGWDRAAGTASDRIPPKNLTLAPERLSIALQDSGWIVRAKCMWTKNNALPQSAPDRPSPAHEHVWAISKDLDEEGDTLWQLVKAERYFYNREGFRTPSKHRDEKYNRSDKSDGWKSDKRFTDCPGEERGKSYGSTYKPGYDAYLKTFWQINTQPSPTKHSATFPDEVARRPILLSTAERVCGECGKPYLPIIRKGEIDLEATKRMGGDANGEYSGRDTKDYAKTLAQNAGKTKSNILRTLVQKVVEGWEPNCECGAEPGRARVLDCFGGIGTTMWVAVSEGREGWMIELNEDYVEVAETQLECATMGMDRKETNRVIKAKHGTES